MNKKVFSKEFDSEFNRLHAKLGAVLKDANPITVSALAAVCSDALVYCMWKVTDGDLEETAAAVSRAVNISLEATRKNL